MQEKPYLSIVITQYNELQNLKAGALDRLFDYMKIQKYSWEVVLNDDGSTDGSREFTEKYNSIPQFHYIKGNHAGKAGGLYNGIKEAKGEWILFTDVDQSTPIKEIEKLLPFTEEFDVVIGSRGLKREKFSLFRKLASFIFRTGRKLFLLHNIEDTQCGFKLFKADKLRIHFPKLEVVNNFVASGWNVTAFDIELLFMFEKAGSKIKEVEVEWKNEDISDSKDRRFVKESLDMVKQILKVVINNIKGRYNS